MLFLTAAGAEIGLPTADCGPRNAGPASLPAQPVTSQSAIGSPNKIAVRMRLAGARRNARIAALDPLAGKINYFTGNDPAKWLTDLSTYGRCKYETVYPRAYVII